MLFIDTELARDAKKNKKRRRFNCFVNEIEKKEKANVFEKKKRNR